MPMTTIDSVLQLVRDRKLEDALEQFGQMAQDPSMRQEVLGHRAWLLRSLGRYEQALDDYRDLVGMNASDSEALARLAETHFLLGHAEDALARAAQALVLDPRHVVATQVLLKTQESLGLITQASPTAPAPSPGSPAKNPVIAALEKTPGAFPASVYPEIGQVLYAFVRCLRPRLALETGSFVGYSSLCIAQAMEENGVGQLHAFDLFLDLPETFTSPVTGKNRKALEVARVHVQQAGLSHRITFHPGDSSAKIHEQFGKSSEKFDFAFIDGDHTLRGCLRDWQAVDNLLTEGGVVALHDTMPDACGWMGPRYLLEELNERGKGSYHWINLPTPEGFGLAFIQKKDAKSSAQWRPPTGEILLEYVFSRLRWRRAQQK